MALEIRLPAMGEGITDATLVRWLVKEGDQVVKDTPVAEIATDKVDTEVLSPEDGIIDRFLFSEGSVIKVGEVFAYLYTGDILSYESIKEREDLNRKNGTPSAADKSKEVLVINEKPIEISLNMRFISPFVRSLAYREGITVEELNSINGSGISNRLTKEDILSYVLNRPATLLNVPVQIPEQVTKEAIKPENTDNEEYIEISRIRKVIAENMLRSKHVSPHVASFVEVNVTKIVNWRNKNKDEFKQKYGVNLTYMPIIVEATAKALKDFPNINASLNGDYLAVKKDINIGIATALADGNLVVPVIKKAGDKSLVAISQKIHELTSKAREQSLQLSDIQDGTFTVTNAGSFGNIGGTPIIRQPELAILAIGVVVKKPVAIKTGENYGVAVQDVVELWLSYDHRAVDGYLGGSFLKRIGDYLEQFDDTTTV